MKKLLAIVSIASLLFIVFLIFHERNEFHYKFSNIIQNEYDLTANELAFLLTAGDRTHKPIMTLYHLRGEVECTVGKLSDKNMLEWAGGINVRFNKEQAFRIRKILDATPKEKFIIAAAVTSLDSKVVYVDSGVPYEDVYYYLEKNGLMKMIGYNEMGRKIYKRTPRGALYSGVFSCP